MTWRMNSIFDGSATCVGANGCVCTESCEDASWNRIVLRQFNCIQDTIPEVGSGSNAMTQLLTALGIALGMCAVFSVLALGARYIVQFLEDRGACCSRSTT